MKLPTLNKKIVIRNVGRLEYSSHFRNVQGMRITDKVLQRLIVRFIKHSAKNVRAKFVPSFAFGEIQLNSSFAPAIADLSDAFLMEYPLYKEDREKKTIPSNHFRRIDYWFYFRDIDFFLELKHNRVSTLKEPERQDIGALWSVVCKQADGAYDRAEAEATLGAKGVVSIGLYVFTVYRSTSKKGIKPYELFKDYDLKDTFDFYLGKLEPPPPNWEGILYFNDDFMEKSSCDLDKGREFYPGLLFFAYVREMNEYKNSGK